MQSSPAVRSAKPRDERFFRPRRLGHVNLFVNDIDRSMAFYHDVVGLQESYRRPLVKAGFLGNGNTHHDIGLVGVTGPLGHGHRAGLNHLAFELETELDLVTSYERAIAAGVTFARTADHDIAHSVYGLDPDGNSHEIYADVVADWRAQRSGIVTKPKPQWAPGMTPPVNEPRYDPHPRILRVDEAVFHPVRTTHAALVVADLDAAVEHYSRVVGLDVLLQSRTFAILGGSLGERSLSLFQSHAGRPAGFHHVGFQVAGDAELDASLVQAKTIGAEVEIAIDSGVRRAVLLRDPDGILLQLYVDRGQPIASLARLPEDVVLYLA
jgi:catechol 2,3-dioxygenase